MAARRKSPSLMKTLLDEKTPPAGRNEAGHTWLRRSAADVLATLGAVGDNRGIFDSLVRIVGDAEEPLSLRCTAAQALGSLVYTDVTGIDALATARQLGRIGSVCLPRGRHAGQRRTESHSRKTPCSSPRGGGYPEWAAPGSRAWAAAARRPWVCPARDARCWDARCRDARCRDGRWWHEVWGRSGMPSARAEQRLCRHGTGLRRQRRLSRHGIGLGHHSTETRRWTISSNAFAGV